MLLLLETLSHFLMIAAAAIILLSNPTSRHIRVQNVCLQRYKGIHFAHPYFASGKWPCLNSIIIPN